ncbi:DUF1840 domain-containing protein [Variovorax paradoxus]|uniref:DUF1840 family protein n=1 Tax=Variovorax paradoxus TaxID=34073 RepID=A0A6I6HNK9_VARPD|nr:DUF1840 domain-containing protein [Variovorax paradoxus]QGW84581.1 DUF1840 family protein [Variovorax paradoxus]
MLYKFQSRATSSFEMLEVHARQLLDIVGKPAAPQGIITVEQIPAAIAAIESALAREANNAPHNHDDHVVEGHANDAEKQHVSLHQRAAPLLRMLRDSLAEEKDVTWST